MKPSLLRHLTLGMLIFMCYIFPTGCARGNAQTWESQMSSIQWVDYSPSTGNPDQQIEPSPDDIQQDLAVLRKAHFTGLVTYSSKGLLGPELVKLAKDAGFRGIVIGVWDPTDSLEIAAAKRAAMSDLVLGICVGNEGLMNKRYPQSSLEAAMEEIRSATKKPVTTSEIIQQYDAKLLSLVDWAFPIAHPYFANATDAKSAVQWTDDRFRQMKGKTPKLLMLKEVGLPTDGDAEHRMSEQAQCEYYDALAKTSTRFVYFEAFDQTWKTHLPVEPHWGIFRSDRSPKVLARHLSDKIACGAEIGQTSLSVEKPTDAVFYIYRDKNSNLNHFQPEGKMGDVGDISIDDNWRDRPHSGSTSVMISYSAMGKNPTCNYAGPCGWAGLYWQDPAGNWGMDAKWKNAGYDLSNYEKLAFAARSDHPSRIKFLVGGIFGPYGDSLRTPYTLTVDLTPEWAEFTIDLTGANLTHIIGGFAWVATKQENRNGATFYLDDIRFEH